MTINVLIAFLAGLATFFSPCILPVVPGYLAVLTAGQRDTTLRRVLFFSLGLLITFTIAGALVALIGSHLILIRDLLIRLLGLALVILGIHLIHPLPFSLLSRRIGVDISKNSQGSDLGALALGTTFGLAWTPCSGVILGAIIAQALLSGGYMPTILLLSFSLGIVLPMLVVAVIFQTSGKYLRLPAWITKYYSPVIGTLVILFGLSLLLGWADSLRSFLLTISPNLEHGLLSINR